MDIQKFINKEGICPRCQSNELHYGVLESDGECVYYPWKCEHCGMEGEEWYHLTFIGHNVIDSESGEIISLD